MSDPTAIPRFDQPLEAGDIHLPRGPEAELLGTMRESVVSALSAEGFRPEIDADGDVETRIEGQPMWVRCFATSPPLMRVSSQWLIDDGVPGDELLRLQAANAMTGVLNLLKVTVLGDRLVIAVDLVVHPAMDLRTLLTATLEAVRSAVQTWHATIVQLIVEQQETLG